METQFDVVVVGAVGIDTNVYLRGEINESVECNFTEDIDCIGQAGGFSSRGYARLGRRVALVASVGDDPAGRWIREDLARDGIDLSGLFTDPHGTSRSINLMKIDGTRKNFYDAKGAMSICPDLAQCREILSRTRLAHVHIVNWSRRLLPMMREMGITIATDVQDVVSVDDPYRRDYVEQSDVLFFSCVNHDDPRPIIEAYRRVNARVICVVGMGARGAALGTPDGVELFAPVAMEAPVVDTNGAGDSLAVGFLASRFLDGFPLRDSLRRGQISARHCCTLRAERAGELITREQLEAHAREQP